MNTPFDPRLIFMILLNAKEETWFYDVVRDITWRPWMPIKNPEELVISATEYLLEQGYVEIMTEDNVNSKTVFYPNDVNETKKIIWNQEHWKFPENWSWPIPVLHLSDFGFEEWKKGFPAIDLSSVDSRYLMFKERAEFEKKSLKRVNREVTAIALIISSMTPVPPRKGTIHLPAHPKPLINPGCNRIRYNSNRTQIFLISQISTDFSLISENPCSSV